MFKEISIESTKRVELISISREVIDYTRKEGIKNGIVIIYTPHTTAGITINEDADPDVVIDLINGINKIIPFIDEYQHLEGNSAAHLKSSLFGGSETVIIENGELLLGRWQGIYFCEFDGPRTRKVYIKTIRG